MPNPYCLHSIKVLNGRCDARPIENKLIFVMGVQFECMCPPRIELNNYDARPIVFSYRRPLIQNYFVIEKSI